MQANALCQHYIHSIYQDIHTHRTHEHGIAGTYGEVLFQSVDKLLKISSLNSSDVFFDLGSGLGKLVLQVFLQSKVKEAYGIEIVPQLHEQSVIAAAKVQQELPEFYDNDRKLHFMLGSFLEIPFDTATVIFICAPCFSQSLLHRIGKIIDENKNIHTVLSLRPIPILQRLSFKKITRIECTWDSALCYVYKDFSKNSSIIF